MGYSLPRSPLSLAVPLDGTDTVQGLRTLKRVAPTDARQSEQQFGRLGRKHYRRYKGPWLETATVADLQRDPKPWRVFLGLEKEGGRPAYSIPASLLDMLERMEENLVTYLPNYLRVALVMVQLSLYLRPRAVFGCAALATAAYFNWTTYQRTAEQQQQQQRRRPPQPPSQAQQQGSLSAVALLCAYLLAAYTGCIPIVALGLALGTATSAAHAFSRRAAREYRHRGKERIDVPMAAALRVWQPVPTGEDPRRVFRELASYCYARVCAGGVAAARAAQYSAAAAWQGAAARLRRARWGSV